MMRITKVHYWKIETGGTSTQLVTEAELQALVLWLVMAYHVQDVAPLTLHGSVFCVRDGYVIKFRDQSDAMSMDGLIELLKDIDATLRFGGKLSPTGMYPLFNEWWNCDPDRKLRVIKIGEVLSYFDQHDEAVLPTALRYCEKTHTWYGVRQTEQTHEGTNPTVIHYKFNNLSPGQL